MLQQTISSKHELSAGDLVALRSFMLNSVVNPYIIGIFNSKFRAYVMGVIGRSELTYRQPAQNGVLTDQLCRAIHCILLSIVPMQIAITIT